MNQQRFSKKLISIATLLTMLATFIVSPTVLAQDATSGFDLGTNVGDLEITNLMVNPPADNTTESNEDPIDGAVERPNREVASPDEDAPQNEGEQGAPENTGDQGNTNDEPNTGDENGDGEIDGAVERPNRGVASPNEDAPQDESEQGVAEINEDVPTDNENFPDLQLFNGQENNNGNQGEGNNGNGNGNQGEGNQGNDTNNGHANGDNGNGDTPGDVTPDPVSINDMVAGKAFEDANGNAVYDDGEPLMEGIRVVLYHSEPGANAFAPAGETFTDVNGEYSFSGLQDNHEYVVSFRRPSEEYNFTNPENFGDDDSIDSDVEAFIGYTLGSSDIFVFDSTTTTLIKYKKVRALPGGYVTDDTDAPVLDGTTNVLAIDAGLIQGPVVTGKVWLDLDKDGLQDANEPGQEGVYVHLNIVVPDDSENGLRAVVRQTVVTDTNGEYTFTNVHPGNYFVAVPKVLAGSLGGGDNFPANCNNYTTRDAGDDTLDSDVEAVDGYSLGASHGFDVTNVAVNNVDAGLICNNLSGVVWEDVNANALQDAGEPGLADFRVLLFQKTDLNSSYTLAGETFTDANGYYNFDALVDGYIYTVGFDRQGKPYNFTYEQNTGDDDTIDSDVEPWITYSMGSSDRFVFDSTKVDSDRLDHIRVAPGGFVLDGEGNPVVNGTVNTGHVDAGLVKYASVSGKVWDDLDKDGVQDEFETGREGINVFLNQIRPDDTAPNGVRAVSVGHAVTDADGNYSFEELKPGKYFVSVPKVLAGSLGGGNNFPAECNNYTTRDAGTDDTIDSDVEAVDGYSLGASHNFDLNNESVNNVDAGLVCNNVTGIVWNDVNANALQDTDEPVFADFRVVLYEATSPTSGFTPIAEDYTDATGRYNFNNLVEGNIYTLSFRITEGMPYRFTYEQNTGSDDTIDSDVEPWIGYSLGSSDRFVFDPTQTNSDRVEHVRSAPGGLVLDGGEVVVNGTVDTGHVDAGLTENSTITGRVWHDVNENGLQDDGEAGLEGVQVFLDMIRPDDSENGVRATAKGIVFTDENGYYTFNELQPGQYFVSVRQTFRGESNLPDNCSGFTQKNVGDDDTIDSDVEPTTPFNLGASHDFELVTDGVVTNVDAGLLCVTEDDTTDGGGTTDDGTDDTTPGGDGTTTDDGDNNTTDDTNTTPNGGGGGGGGRSFIPNQNNNPGPDFTGQSLDDVSLDPCLQLLGRDLTFTDQTDVNAEILKETALIDPGYKGATQYVISGYGNTTNETGSATIGLNNALLRLEAAKIMTTAVLCYQIYDAEQINGGFTFNDIAKVNPENQWFSDLAYTAHHLGILQGRDGNAALLETISKEEFVTMLVRAYQAKYGEITVDTDTVSVDIDPNAWYYNSYLKAKAVGLLTPALESTGTPLSREDAFKAIVTAAMLLNAYTPEAKITVSEQLNN